MTRYCTGPTGDGWGPLPRPDMAQERPENDSVDILLAILDDASPWKKDVSAQAMRKWILAQLPDVAQEVHKMTPRKSAAKKPTQKKAHTHRSW
jgi:hypothetical protein